MTSLRLHIEYTAELEMTPSCLTSLSGVDAAYHEQGRD